MLITKDMTIEEVVQRYPETIPIFARHGVSCLGCSAAQYDNIEVGAQVHGVNTNQLLRELNESISARN